MMFKTPFGRCSEAICARQDAVIGVCSEGFSTTVFPAANAGPTFQIAIVKGQFHVGIAGKRSGPNLLCGRRVQDRLAAALGGWALLAVDEVLDLHFGLGLCGHRLSLLDLVYACFMTPRAGRSISSTAMKGRPT